MKSSRYLTLKVKGYDLANNYFVLSDVLRRFPEDTAITAVFHEHSDDITLFRLHSHKFPEVEEGVIIPQAYYSYDVNTGSSILWPSKEYEDIALDSLSNAIMEYVAKQEEPTITISEVINKTVPVKCNHSWYAHTRGSAIKYCKICGCVAENLLD